MFFIVFVHAVDRRLFHIITIMEHIATRSCCRTHGGGRGRKSTESLTTSSSTDWQDPVEPSTSLLDQHQQPTNVEPTGGGRVISPKELEQELAIISQRDDANRPGTRFITVRVAANKLDPLHLL